jgi:hypothetical protein
MIEIGPIRLVAPDPIYEVLPAHVDLLKSRGFSFEVIDKQTNSREKGQNGAAD